MSRNLAIAIGFAVLLVAAMIFLASVDTTQEVRTIEKPVPYAAPAAD